MRVATTSKTQPIANRHQQYHTPNYAPELAMVRGKGSWIWDADGHKYLDFLAGIAVNTIGHCHPAMIKAIKTQSSQLIHASNLYYMEPGSLLAERLSKLSMGGKVFFANSGAEANEALIKLARKWGSDKGRHEIITLKNSFHGRTMMTLTATGQDKVQKGFAPLPAGFRYAEMGNIDSIKALLSDRTAAVMMEVVQGEGGVVPASPDFVQAVRSACREAGALLLFDEIQTGIGRTGSMFAWQQTGVEPDAFSLAKGLGGGVPIGALVTNPALANILGPGTHGSTFGGNPLVCAAALAVLDTVEKQGLVKKAADNGEYLAKLLKKVAKSHSFIQGIRGSGLMQGVIIDRPAGGLQAACQNEGLLVIATAGTIIRMLPPLTVSRAEIKQAVKRFALACKNWQAAGLK